MTIPRELHIKQVGKEMFVASEPVLELSKIQSNPIGKENFTVSKNFDLSALAGQIALPCRIDLGMEEIKDFSFVLSNDLNEKVIIGYDKELNQYFIDRTLSGKVDFQRILRQSMLRPVSPLVKK